MTTINMPRHRLQALLLLLRRTLELLKPDVIYELNQDRQWKFYYTIAMHKEQDRNKLKPN